MVVEDSNIISRDIQKRLGNLGYEVPATAVSGEEAVEKAGQVQPDLILMDINLKGQMDGIEAAQKIQDQHSIPIVYLTAQSDDATLRRAKLTGPFGYLLKPFEERDLRTTIEVALYKHESDSKVRDESDQNLALFEVARILAQPWSFEDKCKAVLRALSRLGNAEMATLRVPEAGVPALKLVSWAGSANWERPEFLSISQSVAGKAYQEKSPVVENNYEASPLADPSAVSQGIKSVVSIPVVAGGNILGVVNVLSQKPDNFLPRTVRVLTAIADGLGKL
ncbi:MAG: response regulator [Chloroflexi bacterium]|nr:response regulator [Chloroflexota bacterium]MDA1218895.1 response regulator [Chloroflexota bacterium]